MSSVKSSDCDDLEPLLQQQYEEESEDNIVIVDKVWTPTSVIKTNKINATGNIGPNGKPNANLLRHIKNHSIVNSANSLFYRRKRTIIAIAITFLFFLYINPQVIIRNSNKSIPVTHHSHVPGMKALKLFAPVATSDQRNLPTVAVTMRPEKTTRTVRSTKSSMNSSGYLIPLETTAMPSLVNTTRRVVTTTITASTKPTTSSNLGTTNSTNSTILPPPPPSGYLVWSDKCKMPDIDPYTKEMMQFFSRKKYEPCSTNEPLTKVVFNTTASKYVLLINQDQVHHYLKGRGQYECCYQIIIRKPEGKHPDEGVELSKCITFKNSVELANTTDNILVRCTSKKKQIYIHGHAMMPERSEIRQRFTDWEAKSNQKPVSILMIGIDSISRINLIRAMPKTAQYLYDNEWFEMSGYNKVDDNTFPNLMAILTGYNLTTAFEKCKPAKVGGLDNCPLIFKTFNELGYVTAYAEDESSIDTFNYLKMGFIKPPADYYLRPFIIAAEQSMPIRRKSGLNFCLGYKHSADYIYDYAIELATRYSNESFFGLFWSNSFSHNDISTCSSMDEKMLDYLKQFADRGILEESIIIFFSDHGLRFGPTRKFLSGHLEERLPFMFIWLPPVLKHSHPEFINALSVNKNRLTNPYDIHMTLKHVLEISERTPPLPHAPDCPKCQTLLRPVPHSRSCDDIKIEDHWCTCIPVVSINKSSDMAKKVTSFVIDYINKYLTEYKNGTVADKCSKLYLKNIQYAYRAVQFMNTTYDTYKIIFATKPNDGLFEATIRHTDTDTMTVTGSVSRLNSYASDSHCIADGGAKKYCSCGSGTKLVLHTAARAPAG